MDNKIILVAETGSDISAELAEKHGIYLVPMHVSMNNTTLDDGAFPPEDICEYYNRTGKVPTTSGSSPGDFEVVFEKIREAHPDSPILHLAYSAVTTCSYQSAIVAAEGKENIKSFDTKHVSVGQGSVVLEMAKLIDENPQMSIDEALKAAQTISENTKMAFVTENLDYLRAGGRVSNAVAIAGNLLHLHPCIEIVDGKLVAKKKYRGAMNKIVPKLIEDFIKNNNISTEHIYLIRVQGLEPETQKKAEETLLNLGVKNFTWMNIGCVITCHSGPGSFGIVGRVK
ncbi:MAG: DegV family protein [Anaerofustis stercorihominis]|nr:DegV family protein [Anaerofustis stercorihominis]